MTTGAASGLRTASRLAKIVKPAEISRLLPHISLIDVVREPVRFVFRLAGTRVREVYDREVTGLDLTDFDWDLNQDYWLRTYRRIA